uniref:Cytosolic Fe-S cluster assembly factor NBP35 n=1 Tax=Rhizophora mucronata TaxID=61149 RepID=A0A2P2PWU9_RHIMU
MVYIRISSIDMI